MSRRMYPDELEMLEFLSGSDTPFLELERFAFGGDRDKALRSLSLMYDDGSIIIYDGDTPVLPWRLERWRREAALPATERELADVVISLSAWALRRTPRLPGRFDRRRNR